MSHPAPLYAFDIRADGSAMAIEDIETALQSSARYR